MHEEINKPIFVVGSPRSGTSILAWCLGYHPNIFPVPESAWMGDFAVNLAMGYDVGAARGILSVLSAMRISRDELFWNIGRSINSVIIKHRGDLDRQRLITAVQKLLKEKGFYLGAMTGSASAVRNRRSKWLALFRTRRFASNGGVGLATQNALGRSNATVLVSYLWPAQAVSKRLIHPHRA